MLLIACPWCGERDEHEFRCGGESHIARPAPPEKVSDADWGAYLFTRDNPKGLVRERWLHAYGCGQWFNVMRDTTTHRIHAVYRMDETPPEAPG